MKNNHVKFSFCLLFAIVMLDSTGFGMILPVISHVMLSKEAHFFHQHISDFYKDNILAMLTSLFMIASFLFTILLGDLSDIVGRKRILLICLAGSACGYAICAVGITLYSISLLLLGRLVGGSTAASESVAQASIVDLSNSSNKASYISYMLLATCLGFVIGPLLGGILSDKNICHYFSPSTPFIFAALFSMLAACFIPFLSDTNTKKRSTPVNPWYVFSLLAESFRNKEIRVISLAFFIFMSGWSNYFSFINAYLIIKFHYSALICSLFFSFMSAGFFIGFSLLTHYLQKRFSYFNSIAVSTTVAAVSTLITLITPNEIPVWLCAIFIGASVAVAYSFMMTVFSDKAGEDQQGRIMGIANALQSLAFGITPIASACFFSLDINIPFLWTCLAIFICSFISALDKR